ncbi:alpha/beta fold hydrolase [Streptomyces gardneri]|uniref:alpha/beta fold hydrolase n=1 Tax=Nocardia TaxID=1817 RepID=UPI00135AC79D|nr:MULTISPECIES: alpha/beta fold hydrolase [Nocardia]MBF6166501.1 alpha/beta fold hydrolase [Streptomyces gardneri]MBF6205281.1 alpha/beta fold hydrolase [Streptomyces gardneri]
MSRRTLPVRRVIVTVLAAVSLVPVTGLSAADALPAAGPGTITSFRPLMEAELIPSAGKGYRLVYRTTGQNGEPQISAGNIYLPAGNPPPGGWRVVSWGHSTSGIAQGCAPNLMGGIADTFDETPQLSAYLAQGYAVTATDYIGLGAPGHYEYLAGRAAGHAVLDIVRAGRAHDRGLSNSYVLAGHSIGGHSALLAARLSPIYAPELDLRGTVAYAPTSNYEDLIATLSGPGLRVPLPEGLQIRVLMIMAGLDHVRPDLRVTDYLSDRGKQVLALAEAGEGCLRSAGDAVAGRPFGDLFSKPLSDPALITALRDYMAVPTTGYRQPLLLLQGGVDTVQPMPTTMLLQQQLEQGGADSRLLFYPPATHFTLLQHARSDANAFLADVLPPH